MLTADQIKSLLNLQPHPIEGGYFVQTYKSAHQIAQPSLPSGYSGDRSFGTAIYYLLTPDTFSVMHRLPGEEIFHLLPGRSGGDAPVKAGRQWRVDSSGSRHCSRHASCNTPCRVECGKGRASPRVANSRFWAPPWRPGSSFRITRPVIGNRSRPRIPIFPG